MTACGIGEGISTVSMVRTAPRKDVSLSMMQDTQAADNRVGRVRAAALLRGSLRAD